MQGVKAVASDLPRRWCVHLSSRLELALWPSGAVVYDEGTGEMMVLGAAQSAIIQALNTDCMTKEELALSLFGHELENQDVHNLDIALRNLLALGLVLEE